MGEATIHHGENASQSHYVVSSNRFEMRETEAARNYEMRETEATHNSAADDWRNSWRNEEAKYGDTRPNKGPKQNARFHFPPRETDNEKAARRAAQHEEHERIKQERIARR